MLFFPNSAGMAMTSDATDTAITALNGTRARLTRRKMNQPGMPRSRENAYHVREALVSPAAPQNSWPTVQMISTNLAAQLVSPLSITGIDPPPPALIAPRCVAANSSASSTAQPAIADENTDHMPPDRDVVKEGQQAVGEDIHRRVKQEDDQE